MTRRLAIALIALLLGACVLPPKPLSQDVRTRLRQGSTAVLFYDDVGAITYLDDTYRVLGVSTSSAISVYKGTWDSNRELSELHATELANRGMKSQSVYKLLSASQIEELTAAERARYTFFADKKSKEAQGAAAGPAVAAALRDALSAQGQEWLVWIAWSGFTLHTKTLGMAPGENTRLGLWVIDLKENRLVWKAGYWSYASVELGDRTGKEFLESENLQGLKSEVGMQMRECYRAHKRTNQDVGALLGLESAPDPEPSSSRGCWVGIDLNERP